MGLFGFLGPFEALFAFAGSLIVLLLVASTFYFLGKNIYVFFFAERLGHTVDFKSLGEWAGTVSTSYIHVTPLPCTFPF